nr:uncharacterized protein LOC112940370 [Solanum lycopersicum]
MAKSNCFSFTASRNWFLKYSFSNSGLKSSTTDLGNGTIIHCWIPKTHKEKKPSLVLIHGIGANAMWQWSEFIKPLSSRFNLYIPDLLFFGESYTSRPERTESFQAECVMRTMEGYGVKKMAVVGLSYGGFVGYSMAVQFPEVVERLVLVCCGVCFEEKDMENGMFQVKSVDEAVSILLPQSPEKLRELVKLSFYKPIKNLPSCFLNDFIDSFSNNLSTFSKVGIRSGRTLPSPRKLPKENYRKKQFYPTCRIRTSDLRISERLTPTTVLRSTN